MIEDNYDSDGSKEELVTVQNPSSISTQRERGALLWQSVGQNKPKVKSKLSLERLKDILNLIHNNYDNYDLSKFKTILDKLVEIGIQDYFMLSQKDEDDIKKIFKRGKNKEDMRERLQDLKNFVENSMYANDSGDGCYGDYELEYNQFLRNPVAEIVMQVVFMYNNYEKYCEYNPIDDIYKKVSSKVNLHSTTRVRSTV